MACSTCETFPAPTSKFAELAIEESRHATLYQCADCGQLIEQIAEERAPRMISFGDIFRHYRSSLKWPHPVANLMCKQCSREIELGEAIKTSPYSWPYLQAFWHECTECGAGNHIRVTKGQASIIEITGAPGPTWDAVESCPVADLDMRQDHDHFHVRLGDISRSIPPKS